MEWKNLFICTSCLDCDVSVYLTASHPLSKSSNFVARERERERERETVQKDSTEAEVESMYLSHSLSFRMESRLLDSPSLILQKKRDEELKDKEERKGTETEQE
jgi:hypothetical protein